ncbi:hypothetical protein JRQ81_019526 [Phrynocephalus forsythii]|uniref:Uncharacterized protein n=1 Tax=Phrynocephalus forsythii TaxID=171643 RepID=A0A9Q1AYV7_9SAUR|nr:hypothetical protein JRQ81_019526 [Phrynocephalus forsythii]
MFPGRHNDLVPYLCGCTAVKNFAPLRLAKGSALERHRIEAHSLKECCLADHVEMPSAKERIKDLKKSGVPMALIVSKPVEADISNGVSGVVDLGFNPNFKDVE